MDADEMAQRGREAVRTAEQHALDLREHAQTQAEVFRSIHMQLRAPLRICG